MKFETPYIREARNPELSRFHLTRDDTNYSDYNIFTLPINLYPFVRKDLVLDIEEGPLFLNAERHYSKSLYSSEGQDKEEDYVTRYYVVLTDEDGEEPMMTEEEVELFKDAVEMVCADNSNLVFVSSYENQFYTDDKELIPLAWSNAMLPFLTSYKGREAQMKETGLYIIIEPEEDYYKIYHHYQDFLDRWMTTKYKHGYLPSTYTVQFIKDWHLVKKDGLFYPSKKNPMVMGENPVEFFQRRVSVYEKGDFSTFNRIKGVGEEGGGGEERRSSYVWTTPSYGEREKKVLATILTVHRYTFTVDQNRFHVVVSGYEEANSICNSLLRKLSWDEKEMEKMNGIDVEVSYENPYQPMIIF